MIERKGKLPPNFQGKRKGPLSRGVLLAEKEKVPSPPKKGERKNKKHLIARGGKGLPFSLEKERKVGGIVF